MNETHPHFFGFYKEEFYYIFENSSKQVERRPLDELERMQSIPPIVYMYNNDKHNVDEKCVHSEEKFA